MQTLSVKVMVPQEQQFEIPIPFFARSEDQKEWIGLLDEKTVVDVFQCGDLTMIRNKSADSFYTREDLVKAFQKWQACSESEFIDHYNAVIESILLTPKLVQ